ncbi:unnamed protein product [Pleuronectes platessa]|uniref:RING-type domain-containing protein n=1 Tax=Pleuronectes platessa TaxID=8262 RepID=A0A9N7UXD8_PLEPL|nr:unnamed protein product [Pleuronectes platessa]
MLTISGEYAVPAIDAEAYTQGKKEHPPFVPHDQSSSEDDSGPIPQEFMCPICNDVMTNAVVIPCCGYSYCDLCIRMALMYPCKHAGVSPDTLIPNNLLRQRVNNYKNANASEDAPDDQSSPEDDSGPIPQELMCPICNDLMTDAVVIPCCGYSYCELCIRMALLHPCQHAGVSPDTLIPNNLLRQVSGWPYCSHANIKMFHLTLSFPITFFNSLWISTRMQHQTPNSYVSRPNRQRCLRLASRSGIRIRNLLWNEAQKVTQELDHMVTIYHTCTRPHHSLTLIPTPLALYLLLQPVIRPSQFMPLDHRVSTLP